MMNDDDEWLMFRDWWWMPDHDKNGDETVHLRSSYLQVPSNRVLAAPQVETRSVPWCSCSCHVAVTSQTNHPHSGDSEILTSRLSWLCQPQVLGYAGNHKIIQDRSFLGRSYPILELWSPQTVIWYWAAAHLDLDIQKMKFSWPEAKKTLLSWSWRCQTRHYRFLYDPMPLLRVWILEISWRSCSFEERMWCGARYRRAKHRIIPTWYDSWLDIPQWSTVYSAIQFVDWSLIYLHPFHFMDLHARVPSSTKDQLTSSMTTQITRQSSHVPPETGLHAGWMFAIRHPCLQVWWRVSFNVFNWSFSWCFNMCQLFICGIGHLPPACEKSFVVRCWTFPLSSGTCHPLMPVDRDSHDWQESPTNQAAKPL